MNNQTLIAMRTLRDTLRTVIQSELNKFADEHGFAPSDVHVQLLDTSTFTESGHIMAVVNVEPEFTV